MMSKSGVLRLGVQVRLQELERERRALLKLIGEPVSKRQTGLELLTETEHVTDGAEAKPKRKRKKHPGFGGKHWTQTPEGKRKLRAMAKKQHAEREARASQ